MSWFRRNVIVIALIASLFLLFHFILFTGLPDVIGGNRLEPKNPITEWTEKHSDKRERYDPNKEGGDENNINNLNNNVVIGDDPRVDNLVAGIDAIGADGGKQPEKQPHSSTGGVAGDDVQNNNNNGGNDEDDGAKMHNMNNSNNLLLNGALRENNNMAGAMNTGSGNNNNNNNNNNNGEDGDGDDDTPSIIPKDTGILDEDLYTRDEVHDVGESPLIGPVRKVRRVILDSHLATPALTPQSLNLDPCKHAEKGYRLADWNTPEDAMNQYDLFHMSAIQCLDAYKNGTYDGDEKQKVEDIILTKLNFIVYRTGGDGGFGNRVRSMMSTVLAGLLTGRIFLLEWYTPTPWYDMMAHPPGMDWDHRQFLKRYDNTVPGFDLQPAQTITPSDHNMGLDLNDFLKGRLITITSTAPFFYAIMRNNRYTGLVERVLGPTVPDDSPPALIGLRPDGKKTFVAQLLPHLLYPSPQMQKLLQPFLDKFVDHYMVGIHVRTWDGCADQKCLNVFLRCPMQILERDLFPKPLFFLAADRKDLLDTMRAKLGMNNTIIYDSAIVHYCDIQGNQGDGAIQALAKLVADFWLLGDVDLFFGTWYSSFTENAAFRTNVPTYLVGNEKTDQWPDWCKDDHTNVIE